MAAPTTPVSAHRLAFPAMVLASVLLAFGPLLVRMADVEPIASAWWRMGLAVAPLALLARTTRQAAPPPVLGRAVLGLAALGGVFFAVDLALWHLGIMRTTLANASLLSNAASFLLPLWGFIVLGHRPGKNALFALACALVGTILLVGRSAELSGRHFAGDLLCLVAALFYTAYLIVVDRLRGTLRPYALLALTTFFGAAVFLPFAWLMAGSAGFWPHDWTPLVLLALGSQVIGQGLVVFAVGHLKPIVVGLALLIQPAIGGIIGALRFGEVPGAPEITGALFIVAALILVRLPERR
ncbi:MAG: DMT family transporter [Sandarakinorhabdus sp.]|nr:DMT family transporter [Sandarakinorhabdus sp.]